MIIRRIKKLIGVIVLISAAILGGCLHEDDSLLQQESVESNETGETEISETKVEG